MRANPFSALVNLRRVSEADRAREMERERNRRRRESIRQAHREYRASCGLPEVRK